MTSRVVSTGASRARLFSSEEGLNKRKVFVGGLSWNVTDDSLAFARLMLEETGVAATPGVDFDEARGRRFLRFSYAGATADMAQAAARLKAWGRLQA